MLSLKVTKMVVLFQLIRMLKFFVLCRRVNGRFTPNIETTEIRYFEEGRLPRLSETRNTAEQIAMCFAAHRDPDWVTLFE